MSLFHIHIEEGRNGLTECYLSGKIDEDSVFPKWPTAVQSVRIHLEGVKAINSCGTREWIRWIQELPFTAQVECLSCPKCMIDQMNWIEGFLPKGARIASFWVPYFCERCSLSFSCLVEIPEETRERVPCEKCETPAEAEVIVDKYLKRVRLSQ